MGVNPVQTSTVPRIILCSTLATGAFHARTLALSAHATPILPTSAKGAHPARPLHVAMALPSPTISALARNATSLLVPLASSRITQRDVAVSCAQALSVLLGHF